MKCILCGEDVGELIKIKGQEGEDIFYHQSCFLDQAATILPYKKVLV